jgi:hypothetical protein
MSSATKSLKSKRVAGSDGLPLEIFKYAGPDFVKEHASNH